MPECPECHSNLSAAQFASGVCLFCNAKLRPAEDAQDGGPIDLTSPCPMCKEPVSLGAPRCPYCGEHLAASLSASRPPVPDTGMTGAVLATIFCCWPVGIVAIIFAAQVRTAYAAGDYELAQSHADWANRLTLLSIVGGLIALALVVVAEYF